MVSALSLAGGGGAGGKQKQHRGPQAGPAKEKKKEIDKKKRGVDGGKGGKNAKVGSVQRSSSPLYIMLVKLTKASENLSPCLPGDSEMWLAAFEYLW